MNNQKGSIQAVVLIILVLGIASGIYLVGQRTNLLPQAWGDRHQVNQNQSQDISNDNELRRTLNDLENTNIDGVDAEYNNWGRQNTSIKPSAEPGQSVDNGSGNDNEINNSTDPLTF